MIEWICESRNPGWDERGQNAYIAIKQNDKRHHWNAMHCIIERYNQTMGEWEQKEIQPDKSTRNGDVNKYWIFNEYFMKRTESQAEILNNNKNNKWRGISKSFRIQRLLKRKIFDTLFMYTYEQTMCMHLSFSLFFILLYLCTFLIYTILWMHMENTAFIWIIVHMNLIFFTSSLEMWTQHERYFGKS